MATQAALIAGGCSRPREEIVPYVRMPERLTPGEPLKFATTLELGGYGRGVICTSLEGRPIKVEGNPRHPASLGATDVFSEAAVLSLYDPDRSQVVRRYGEIADWATFVDALQPRLRRMADARGDGLRLLTGPLASPTARRQVAELARAYPRMIWHVHDPLADSAARQGAQLAFGRQLLTLPRLADAEVILSLDADPLGPGPMQVMQARGFAARRRARAGGASLGRLYALESTPTLTGANADHRLAVPPAALTAQAFALAAAFGGTPQAPDETNAGISELARDLIDHRGRAIVLAGPTLAAEVHALCHWMNAALEAPVDYFEPLDDAPPEASLADLVRDLDAGRVQDLIVIGCNPGYDSPALDFARAAAKAEFRIHLGLHYDETAALSEWHIPQSHALERWSDSRAPDGSPSLCQPLIAPLYDTRSTHELLAALAHDVSSGYELVRRTWSKAAPAAGFEDWWRQALHDGVISGVGQMKRAANPAPARPDPPAAAPASPTLVLRPDPGLYDGSFANNGWLQELPNPLTKEVWGNSVGVAPADAARLEIADGDLLRLTAHDASIEAPSRIDPELPAGIMSLALGHGRTAAGAVGSGVGVSGYALRGPQAQWAIAGIEVASTGRRQARITTQPFFALEGEAEELFHSRTLDEFDAMRTPHAATPASFLSPPRGSGPQWGMTIDTTLCIGCNACVVACEVENNSPVIGPEEIARGRDMHWLRIDRYDLGSEDRRRVGFQPVPCMHCETAPCEPVCPTAASVHDAEGLNVQVYNRCIGTRFCEANCPYKVRRFNFFGYADGQEYENLGADSIRAHYNPDVTVRARGVMEKCTYCVQRISRARIAAERERRPLADGAVVTACQAACPTEAISFGDISTPDAQVAFLRQQPHHYRLLDHLNTRPRTTYLAQVRNPNPKFAELKG